MKFRYLTPLCLIVFFLESTFFESFRIFGVSLDMPLILIVVLTLLFSEKEGYFVALVSGLMRDAFYSKALGVTALSFMIIVTLIGLVRDAVHKESYLNSSLVAVAATVLYNIFYYLFNLISENRLDIFQFPKIVTIESLYNAFICYFIYRFVFKRMYWKQGV